MIGEGLVPAADRRQPVTERFERESNRKGEIIMTVDPSILSLDNPVFQTYVAAASLMILKLMLQPWMTVVRMLKVGAGFRSPEDAKKSPLNPRVGTPARREVRDRPDGPILRASAPGAGGLRVGG